MQVKILSQVWFCTNTCHSEARNNLEMVYSIDTLVYSYVCIYRLPTCLQGRSQDFSRGTHNFPNPPPSCLPSLEVSNLPFFHL